jgi:predicted dehydrogenase/nucleoside-diphosphate-sugar epimerase
MVFRVAVLGAGYVAPYHLRALQSIPGVEIVALADPDTEKTAALAKQFSIQRVAATLEDLSGEHFDVVHILTPPHLHADLAIAAMRRGCHVFVEKPMAETVEDCDRIIAASCEYGRVVTVNHSYRFDPMVLRALDLVAGGAIGDVLSVDILRSSNYTAFSGGALPAPYRNGSYPLQDLGVHALYLLEAFLGNISSVEVHYKATGRQPLLHFDEWRIYAECEKGAAGVYMSWNNKPIQNDVIIHGTKGNLYVDCYISLLAIRKALPAPMPITRMINAGSTALSNIWNVPLNTVKFATGRLQPNPGIGVHITRFYDALRKGMLPPVSPESSRRIMALLAEPSARADAEKARAFAIVPARKQPRVLVTGAAGFLGGTLLRRLRERGESLRILQRRPPEDANPDENLHVMAGDLGDPSTVDKALEGIEVVYHVGAAMKGGRMEFDCGTIWGTKNVVDACVEHGVKRLIHVSSFSVLDHAGHKSGVPVNENSPLEPTPDLRGNYTRTKLVAEKYVLQAVSQRDLNAVILRPGHIFGPGADFPPQGALGLAGRWVVIGDGSLPVPFVYVDDVVDALLLAESYADGSGQIFHIVDADAKLTQREFIDYVQAHSAKPPKSVYVSQAAFLGLGFGVELLGKALKREVPLTPYRIKSTRPLWPCDISAAKQKLGWKPRVGIIEGMVRTYGQHLR